VKPPKSVLVVVTRRIGDVLLTTPLIRSLKQAWPNSAIDVLVFAGTEGVLAANPDIRRVLTISERPSFFRHLGLLWQFARRYDVALSVVPSDKPTLYAWLAGRWRAGLVLDTPKHRWKTWLLQRWVPFDDMNTHTVPMLLALAGTVNVPPCYDVVAGWDARDRDSLLRHVALDAGSPYVVLHPFPKFNYKMWNKTGWVETAHWLQAQGLRVVLSGGKDSAELDYVADIARNISDIVNLSGKLSLSQAACLLAHARLYVGPDTALTHMAAALGVPVVAIFGPGNPVKWGPWPARYAHAANPWRRHGTQRVNNVTLVQGQLTCVPCLNEGCERHVASFSDCLQQLPARQVIAAISSALEIRPLAEPSHG
jgi:heptosyltransferase III